MTLLFQLCIVFLSTPSARRATLKDIKLAIKVMRISIHALREEGDGLRDRFRQVFRISIHALREEGDLVFSVVCFSFIISIHALREEGDL